MDDAPAHLWFDYVDPVCFVVDLRLRQVEARLGTEVERRGWEIAPAPAEPLNPRDPVWAGRWEAADAEARREGLELVRPRLVPRTRKAHELALHASETGEAFRDVHEALYRAHHLEARDIGRIDVLVDIGEGCGLDPEETRTVLGIDRYLPGLRARRDEAERAGVLGVPTLALGDHRLEGLAGEERLASLLAE